MEELLKELKDISDEEVPSIFTELYDVS